MIRSALQRPALSILALALLSGCERAPAPASIEKVSAPGRYSGHSAPVYDGYERASLYVPMRDGVRLAVDLFRPTREGAVTEEKLPVVWMHTPYNRRVHPRRGDVLFGYSGNAGRLLPYGYVIAVADFRGVHASFGRNNAYNRGEWVDEAKFDAYDMTEWLAAQPWSSGKVGMWGCSATGGSQMQALTVRPPSLKAVIPMSAEFDAYPVWTLGGIPRAGNLATPGSAGDASAIAERDRVAAPVDGPEAASLLAEAVASHKDNIESVGFVPMRDSVSPTTGEVWWRKSSTHPHLETLKAGGIGVLSVANWDEAGTKLGPFQTFGNLPKDTTKLLVGPARHCDWDVVREQTGFDLLVEELRFFDHWLKGIDNGVMSEPAVTYFTYNAPPGSQWRRSEVWPLASEKRTDYFLTASGLSTRAPAEAVRRLAVLGPPPAATSILIEAAEGGLAFETPPLQADMEVTGHPVLNLFIETKLSDVDVTARLEEVTPDGKTHSYQMLGRLRALHRKLAQAPFETYGLPWRTYASADAEPLPSGQPIELAFDLLPMSYIFRAESRVRLSVTFSGAGREPVTLLSGPAQGSRLVLPVIPVSSRGAGAQK